MDADFLIAKFWEYAREWWPSVSALGVALLARMLAKFIITQLCRFTLPRLQDVLELENVEQDTQDITRSFYRPVQAFLLVAGLFGFVSLAPVAHHPTHDFMKTLTRCTFIICAGWSLYNLTDVNKGIFAHRFKNRTTQKYNTSIALLAGTVVHVVVVLICAAMVAQEFSFNISAFLASMGIGSLAIALAAKDTLANAFGGLSILIDQPFLVGDWIRVNGLEGTVQKITYRNTSIRTFDNELIYLPNSTLTNAPITNFSRREKRRILYSLGLTYRTTETQMRAILADLRAYVENNPSFTAAATKAQGRPDYEINFYDFGDSALIIRISCYTVTTKFVDYLTAREEFNLEVLRIVQRHGASCAFPSTSIYFENELSTQQQGWSPLTAQQVAEKLAKR